MIKNVYYFIVICCLLTKIKATTGNTWPDQESLINESVTYKTFTERIENDILKLTKYLNATLGQSITVDERFFNFPLEYNIGDNEFNIILISYNDHVPVFKIVEKEVCRCVLKIEPCDELFFSFEEAKYEALSKYENIAKCIFLYLSKPDKREFEKNNLLKQYAFYYFEFLDIKLNYSFCFSNGKCLDEVKLKKLLKDVLEGLKDMHKIGYVHGDIKLENVLGYNNGEEASDEITYKIIDFELTQKLFEPVLSAIHNDFYTLGYRPPEMSFSGEKRTFEPRYESDIWAFGCLVYYLSIGRFSGIITADHDTEVGLDKFEEFISQKVCYEAKLSPNLAKIILDCLKLNYKDRPTVSELLGYSFFLENNNSITD